MNPRCPIKNLEDFVDVAESSGSTGREDCQAQWQSAVAQLFVMFGSDLIKDSEKEP